MDDVLDALREHPAVRAACRVVGRGSGVEVIPDPDSNWALANAQQFVTSWQAVFDDCYEAATPDDEKEFAGWVDKFTGNPLPREHLAEWVEATVSRVCQLGPSRILEIGAGTGLLLVPLVERLVLEEYCATDLATASVRRLDVARRRLDASRPGTRIEVVQAAATELPPKLFEHCYDTVLLNSVAQYFPTAGYFEKVLCNAVSVVAEHGHVYLGDLRHEGLRTAVALATALGRGATADAVDATVERLCGSDAELSFAPEYIHRLADRIPRVTAVEVMPRAGSLDNEMTLFRFDAILHIGCSAEPASKRWWNASDVAEGDLVGFLQTEDRAFGLRGLRNARLVRSEQDQVVQGHTARRPRRPAFQPDVLRALGADHGWQLDVRLSLPSDRGDLDVWCTPAPTGHGAVHVVPPVVDLVADFRQPALPPLMQRAWVHTLSTHLAERLPDCPHPTSWSFVLDRLNPPCLMPDKLRASSLPPNSGRVRSG